MKTLLRKASIGVLVLAALAACTDKRRANDNMAGYYPTTPLDISPIQPVANVQYRGSVTETLQMFQAPSGNLFLSGKPYGFALWDVMSNPESPYLTAAMAEQVDSFSNPATPWTPDNYASGALMAAGNLVFSSGLAGASVIDVSDAAHPREIRRYPQYTPNSTTVNQDTRFVWQAMAQHPTLPIVYGFRLQDGYYAFQVNGGNLSFVGSSQTPNPYQAGTSVCCVVGAANFAGRIFVAFRSHLRIFTPQSDGSLAVQGNDSVISMIQPVAIASTQRFLYVLHQPQAAAYGSTSLPGGIYVFDTNGNQVNYFNVTPRRFSVTPDDSHLYANDDNTRIRIYRIEWTNYQ